MGNFILWNHKMQVFDALCFCISISEKHFICMLHIHFPKYTLHLEVTNIIVLSHVLYLEMCANS